MTHDNIKRANWLELLFDLVFVFAIAKATHILAHAHDGHLSGHQYLTFVLVMIPIWWTWTGHTMYCTRFDFGSVTHKILTLAMMLATLFWSAFIDGDFSANYYGYLGFYIAIRLLLIAMYIYAGYKSVDARPIAKQLSVGFLIGLAVMLASLFFDSPIRYALFYAGLTIEILSPLLCRAALKKIPVKNHHLPEGYGLLTIIVLGESIIMLGSLLRDMAWQPTLLISAVAGFITVACLWWLYFGLTDRHALRKNIGPGQRHAYGHMFIYIGLSAQAVFIGFTVQPALTLLHLLTLLTFSLVVLISGLLLAFGGGKLLNRSNAPIFAMLILSTIVSFANPIANLSAIH